ncbi:(2Fe-2S)-binding protein [Streptomyces sp. NPDC050418]|uniref:(2Fe-2S)-binding protein n=1 Tax=Streptomyces sp. NPDC050418 TaxID=3365612 RepID=UPI0037941234
MPEPLTAQDISLVASVGGFFALRRAADAAGGERGDGSGGARRAGAPLAALYAGDATPLMFRVAKVGAAIGAPEPRIAVSIAHLGLAARLWSVALGSAALHGRIPDLDPALLHWDPDGTSPDDLTLAGSGARHPEELAAVVLDHHLTPLAAAVRTEFRISEGLLWGNAGSALAASAREIGRWARRTGQSAAAARARTLAAELFTDPRLRGTGEYEGPDFRRRSCCLYYRVPGGGVCGDCCFRTPPPPRSSAPHRTG